MLFLVIPSLLSFFIFPSITCFIRQFLRKIWKTHLTFLSCFYTRNFSTLLLYAIRLYFSHDWSNCNFSFFPSQYSETSQTFPIYITKHITYNYKYGDYIKLLSYVSNIWKIFGQASFPQRVPKKSPRFLNTSTRCQYCNYQVSTGVPLINWNNWGDRRGRNTDPETNDSKEMFPTSNFRPCSSCKILKFVTFFSYFLYMSA